MLDTHSEVRERPDARPLADLRQRRVPERRLRVRRRPREATSCGTCRSASTAGRWSRSSGSAARARRRSVNLMPRFYDVTAGAILIDGMDIRDVTLTSLRAQIGIVTQETVLFDDTIAANIAYGSPGASQADIEAAARAAHAHEFILALPTGLPDAHRRARPEAVGRPAAAAGDRARAAEELADPDPRRGDLVARRRVRAAGAGRADRTDAHRTAFVIAHRLSTVRRADTIVVLERGRVAEIGRHEELLARPGGVYAKLYALQAFGDRRSFRLKPEATQRWSVSAEDFVASALGRREQTDDQEHDRLRLADRRRRGRDDQRDRAIGEPPVSRSAAAHAADAGGGRAAPAGAGPAARGARPGRGHGRRAAAPGAGPRGRAERGVPRGARRGARAGARAGLRRRRDDARRPAALSAGAVDQDRPKGTRHGGAAARPRRASRRRSRRRSTSSTRCGRARAATCAPSSTRGARCSASCSSRSPQRRTGARRRCRRG